MTSHPANLWRHRDFMSLWAASTVSAFGSLITRAALPFLAVLTLGATPAQMAVLRAAELVPAVAIGLVAGVWVDRLRRRPIMIAADVGRALVLCTIPLAAVLGALRMEQLYLVALVAATFTTFFDVAHLAYLPSLVRRDELVQANSLLTGGESAAEFLGFGISGVLVQWITAPFAILVDAVTFVVSALFLGGVRAPERPRPPADDPHTLREIAEGLRAVTHHAAVRRLAAAYATLQIAFGIFGTVYTLYAARDVGFAPAVLGVIYGIGGISSIGGAVVAGPASRRLGTGVALIAAAVITGIGMAFIPLATAATVLGATFLIIQQVVGDSAAAAFMVMQVSLRQAVLPHEAIGRANAAIRVLGFAGTLAGTGLGGLIGEAFGARIALVAGSAIAVLSAAWLVPVRGLRQPIEAASDRA